MARTSFSAPEAHIVVSTDGYFDVYPTSARTNGDKPAYRGRLAELGAGIRGVDDRLAVRPDSVALAEAVTAWSAVNGAVGPGRRPRQRPRRQRGGRMKRRKVTYPVAKTHTKGAPRPGAGRDVVDGPPEPRVHRRDRDRRARRTSRSGPSVRINGTGLYAGEEATIERLVAGVIPAATVRTDVRRDPPRPDDRPRPDRRAGSRPVARRWTTIRR